MPERSVFDDHEKRIETLEEEVKGLREWRHKTSNVIDASALKIDELRGEMQEQDKVLKHQSNVAERTLALMEVTDDAIRGNQQRAGLHEQIRAINLRDEQREQREDRREKTHRELVKIVFAQLIIALGAGIVWIVRQMAK